MATDYWLGPINGNWNTDSLWSANVPQSGDTAEIVASGAAYTVTLSNPVSISSLNISSTDATFLETSSGSLTLTGAFDADKGTIILNGTNTLAFGVELSGALLETHKAAALGANQLQILSGEWLATGSQSVTNAIALQGSATIAAAHGKTLTLTPTTAHLYDSSSFALTFGAKHDDGTVVWNIPGTFTVDSLNNYVAHIADGTLTGSGVQSLLTDASKTLLDSGATIDMGGNDVIIYSLHGAGTITDADADTLRLESGDFSGKLTGALELEIAGSVQLTGADNFKGGTSIDAGQSLTLGDGKIAGSVTGAIANNGYLYFDESGNSALNNAISGNGQVEFYGKGMVTIHRAEHQTGDTYIEDTTASIDRGTALGTGATVLEGHGTLLATKSLTLAELVASNGPATTIEAAHGKTLTMGDGGLTFDGPTTFGSSKDNGTIVLKDTGTITAGGTRYTLAAGTLKGGAVSEIFDHATQVILKAGTTADLTGTADIDSLSGSGTLHSTASMVQIDSGTFGGKITGGTKLFAGNNYSTLTLTANGAFSGNSVIEANSVLRLGNGGKTGSISGNLSTSAGSTLVIDHSNAVSLNKLAISSSGGLVQAGKGTTTIDRAETYTGNTTVTGGTLSIDRSSALGSNGALTLAGGNFTATKSLNLVHTLNIAGNTTIAAAHGTTLTVGTGPDGRIFGNGEHIVFGSATNDGTINWHFDGDTQDIDGYSIEIAGGTLRVADNNFVIADYSTSFKVDSGAELDMSSYSAQFSNLSGGGEITGKSGTVLDVMYGSLSGKIEGGLSVWADHTLTLSGGGNFSGGAFIQNGATLTLVNAAQEDVKFATSSNLVLKTADKFTGTIKDFTGNDTIDLTNINRKAKHFNLSFSHHELTVTDGTHTDVIAFAGSYTANSFHASSDGHGGTLVTDPPLHDDPMAQALADHAAEWFQAHAHVHDGMG